MSRPVQKGHEARLGLIPWPTDNSDYRTLGGLPLCDALRNPQPCAKASDFYPSVPTEGMTRVD